MGTPVTSHDIKQSLCVNTLNRDWTKVIEIFMEHPEFYTAKITNSEDTVLHVAVTLGADNTLVQLLNAMEEKDRVATKKALEAKNKQGDTPLHCAAGRISPSSPTMCKRIVSIAPLMVGDRNNERETPLFLAALGGHKKNFLYLHSVAKDLLPSTMTPPWRRKGGETILHCTIQREYFDLAFTIIHLYRDEYIASSIDEKGITPLHVLATKPSAFRRSTRLPWWSRILYPFMVVEPLKIPVMESEELHVEGARQNQSQDSHALMISEEPKSELPENYHTCRDFFEFLWDLARSVTSKEAIGRNSEREARDSTSPENSFFPLNYASCFEFFKSSYFYIFSLFGIGLMGIKKIKQKHVWCTQIMEELVEQNSEYEWIDGSDPSIDQSDEDEMESIFEVINKPKTNSSPTDLTNANGAQQNQQVKQDAQRKEMDERLEVLLTKLSKPKQDPVQEERDKKMIALLTVTKYGAIELVEEILEREPVQEKRDTKMTALLTAAKYGVIELVEGILERIPVAIHDKTKEGKNILHVAVENRQPVIFDELKKRDVWYNLIETTDVNGNNVLHLAATVSKYKPWQIPGAAMQMQWEIKWYEYVQQAVPQHLIFQTNKDDDTPGEIFNESHKDLLQDGGEWLKSTCNSYSVVAVLIAGVSFATSTNVPGGTNDQTGKSPLEGQLAFNIFAISSMVALSFSITQLVMFLAILTSRQQPKDFRRDLPFKLLLGLTSLFVSIASTLVSFCAAYFFVLKDKLSTGVYVVYTATCLPVSFYAITQFPLYLDLLKAIFTDVPQPSYKDDDF